MDPLHYLNSLEHFGIKLGLSTISTLAERMGHPERAYRSVHVAGTNGKGSVTAMVDSALRAAGHRSARYTSPHLVHLTERYTIDGRAVGHASLVAVVGDIRDLIESLRRERAIEVQPTFFEVATLAAFELFRRAAVDVAVFEVGLGGRLDATNIVQPLVSAITSIAFDHEQHLGSTLGAIAREKAGIIKEGVPVVVGPMADEAALAIADIAQTRHADLIRATAADVGDLAIGLAGAHQRANAAVALKVLQTLDARGLRVPAAAIADGLARPGWTGRLDLRRLPDGREALLDAAHNPAGAAALASYLKGAGAGWVKPPLVFAAMRDKNAAAMFDALLPTVGPLILTRASSPRSASPDELAALARRAAPGSEIVTVSSPVEALDTAWTIAPRIVVAGSIFLLGDVLKVIDAT